MNKNDKVLNNKGFTLIELLTVVTILAAFAVVAVTNVTNSLKKSDEKNTNTQNMLAITAAKIFFSNEDAFTVGAVACIDNLVADNYVSSESVESLHGKNKCVKITESGYVIKSGSDCGGGC